jgi:hypothetical protein
MPMTHHKWGSKAFWNLPFKNDKDERQSSFFHHQVKDIMDHHYFYKFDIIRKGTIAFDML